MFLEQNRCFRNENGIPERAAFRLFAADSCFICGDPHGVSGTALCGIAQEFYFLFYDRLPALQKMLLWLCLFHKGRAFSLLRRRQYSGNGSSVPQKKAMQLSALQCDSFRVSKFVIQTEKQDFF